METIDTTIIAPDTPTEWVRQEVFVPHHKRDLLTELTDIEVIEQFGSLDDYEGNLPDLFPDDYLRCFPEMVIPDALGGGLFWRIRRNCDGLRAIDGDGRELVFHQSDWALAACEAFADPELDMQPVGGWR